MLENKFILVFLVTTLDKNEKLLCCCTLISPIYTFYLVENIFVYTPRQHTNREKYLDY